MKRLDKFLEVLFLRRARCLVLQTGSAAFLEGSNGTSDAVMQRTLSSAHIISAIGELMPRYLAEGFSGGDREQFEYDAPAGRVQVRFAPQGDRVRAELRPVSDAASIVKPRVEVAEPAELVEAVHEELQVVDTFDRAEQSNGAMVSPASLGSSAAGPAASQGARPIIVATAGHGVAVRAGRASSDPAASMQSLLDLCASHGASDLHLTSGAIPALRVDGDIRALDGWAALCAGDLTEMLWAITPVRNREQWMTAKDTDFAHETADARYRVNVFCDRSGIAAVLRRIPGKVFSAEEMGIPEELLDLCFLPKGLILVTGPTGSGKSTTLAAMLDHVNRSRDDNIITIEDPIEFVHQPRRCTVHQREVGVHTDSFKSALRAALREDPDVVLIGEMRDLETVSIALETAETGHLVFGTLHTNTAPSTVDRIIDQFPADRQSQIRTMLSESLKAVLTQTLCKKIGGGRVAAREVLLATGAVSNLIREGKTFQLASIMQTGRGQGMQTLNDALLDLVRKKLILPQEALAKSVAKADLRKSLEAAGLASVGAEA
jgi:twitching motility protein PilT